MSGRGKSASTPKPISTSKWIIPRKNVCEANNGKFDNTDKIGLCLANWENAKKICSFSGKHLPTRNDLHKIITNCGGIINAENKSVDKNLKNDNYQSCYKKKGFIDGLDYWSSTSFNDNMNWTILLSFGSDHPNLYSNQSLVMCIP